MKDLKETKQNKKKPTERAKLSNHPRGKVNEQVVWTVQVPNLLGDGEGLVVELLDELAGHLVRVVGGRVGALLLQEVDLDGHGTDALLGLVKVVVGHYEGMHRGRQLEILASQQMTSSNQISIL